MEKKSKELKALLFMILFVMSLSAFSLSLIPFLSDESGKTDIASYILAGLFWCGFLTAIIATIVMSVRMKKHYNQLVEKGKLKRQRLPGIISFSLSIKNIVVYAVIATGLILIITDIILTYIPIRFGFLIISLTVLFFAYHCVIDGKYYKMYKYIKEKKDDEISGQA